MGEPMTPSLEDVVERLRADAKDRHRLFGTSPVYRLLTEAADLLLSERAGREAAELRASKARAEGMEEAAQAAKAAVSRAGGMALYRMVIDEAIRARAALSPDNGGRDEG